MKLLLTGVISGIGRHLLMELGRDSAYDLIGVDRCEVKELPEEAASLLKDYYPCDLGDTEQVKELAGKITARHPDLEAAILNAGDKNFKHLAGMSEQELEHTLKVNTLAPMLLSKAFFGAFNPFTVILMGSSASFRAHDGTAVYGASKIALNGFTEGLSEELKPGQRIHTLCPTLIATDELLRERQEVRESAGNGDTMGSGRGQGKPRPTRRPEDVNRAVRRIIEGRELRLIVPVVTPRLKARYMYIGMRRLGSQFCRRG